MHIYVYIIYTRIQHATYTLHIYSYWLLHLNSTYVDGISVSIARKVPSWSAISQEQKQNFRIHLCKLVHGCNELVAGRLAAKLDPRLKILQTALRFVQHLTQHEEEQRLSFLSNIEISKSGHFYGREIDKLNFIKQTNDLGNKEYAAWWEAKGWIDRAGKVQRTIHLGSWRFPKMRVPLNHSGLGHFNFNNWDPWFWGSTILRTFHLGVWWVNNFMNCSTVNKSYKVVPPNDSYDGFVH